VKKIFIFGIVLRLIILFLFKNISNYDLQSYLKVGELTIKGINIYPNIANLHHPYFPAFLYLESCQSIIFLKSLNLIFDLGILYLVYLLSKQSWKKTLLYALNPITAMIFFLHGQFDAVPIFFLLLSIYLFQNKKPFLSLLSYSFSVMMKSWPVMFILAIYQRLKNKKLIFLSIFFPILSIVIYCLIFKTSPLNILQSLIYYQGVFGIWGVSKIFSLIHLRLRYQKLIIGLFLFIFFLYSSRIQEKDFIKKIYLLLLFFFSFSLTFSIQYLSWLIPFLCLTFPKYIYKLMFLITSYLLSFYSYWIFCSKCTTVSWHYYLPQQLLGLILWLTLIKYWYNEKNKLI